MTSEFKCSKGDCPATLEASFRPTVSEKDWQHISEYANEVCDADEDLSDYGVENFHEMFVVLTLYVNMKVYKPEYEKLVKDFDLFVEAMEE